MFSILCSNYNNGAYLEEMFISVLNQKYTNFELLIFDDGSSDHSYDIMKKYKLQDTRIKLFKSENNMGLFKSVPFLISKIDKKTEFVCFLDSDDVYKSNNLEIKYEYIKKNATQEVFLNNMTYINSLSELLNKEDIFKEYSNFFLEFNKKSLTLKEFIDLIFYKTGIPISHTNLTISKEIIKTIQFTKPLYNKNYSITDIDIIIFSYAFSKNIGFIDDPIALHRKHTENYTKNNNLMIHNIISFLGRIYKDNIITKQDLKNYMRCTLNEYCKKI